MPTHEVIHEEEIEIGALAIEHILDSHSWHLWGHGEDAVSIPLPVIFYSSKTGLNMFSSSKFGHGHESFNGYSLHDEKIISEDTSESIYDLSITKNVVQMMISMIILFKNPYEVAPSHGLKYIYKPGGPIKYQICVLCAINTTAKIPIYVIYYKF